MEIIWGYGKWEKRRSCLPKIYSGIIISGEMVFFLRNPKLTMYTPVKISMVANNFIRVIFLRQMLLKLLPQKWDEYRYTLLLLMGLGIGTK